MPADKKPQGEIQQSTQQPRANAPRLFNRNEAEFRHDLFKLMPAPMKKNANWNMYDPRLIDVEHAHFFHSVDRKGTKQTQCVATGGHFHEVKVDFSQSDANGNPKVEVGPPLKVGMKKLKSGKRVKQIIPVEWYDEKTDKTLVDDHRHEVVYQGSEILKPTPAGPQRSLPLALEVEKKHIPGVEISE